MSSLAPFPLLLTRSHDRSDWLSAARGDPPIWECAHSHHEVFAPIRHGKKSYIQADQCYSSWCLGGGEGAGLEILQIWVQSGFDIQQCRGKTTARYMCANAHACVSIDGVRVVYVCNLQCMGGEGGGRHVLMVPKFVPESLCSVCALSTCISISYMHTYMHAYTCTCLHTCLHGTCMYVTILYNTYKRTMHVCNHFIQYIQTNTRTNIHPFIHTCKHGYMHTSMQTYIQSHCMHAYMHTYTRSQTHTYIHYTYIHTYKHTYKHTYIHACKCTYTYTHKCILTYLDRSLSLSSSLPSCLSLSRCVCMGVCVCARVHLRV